MIERKYIVIHQYKMNGMNLVIDVNSGAIHLFDECSYEFIELLNQKYSEDEVIEQLKTKYPEADLIEVKNEIQALIEQKVLFTEDEYAQVVESFGQRETVVKALCLHVAHDCNLACQYCFAEEGEYHGDRSIMPLDIAKKSIDFLIKHSGQRKNLEVDFFGGEPLMNFDVVKETVFYAKGLEAEHNKKFRFTITTNGVLLDQDKMDFINEHMYNVVLSCDGRKEVHDYMRPASNKKGSYDLIMPKFKELIKQRGDKSYYIRGTFTHHNLDFAEDVLHMAREGFDQISVEPVVAPLDEAYAIQKEDIPQLLKEYEHLAQKMMEYKEQGTTFNFFHFMIDLTGGPCVAKRLTGCGAGFEYMAVTPQGDLYPCHQFVGMEQFKMGDLDTGVENLSMQQEFKGCNVYSKKACQSCWAKFYCSGGCSANAYNFQGSITEAYEMGCDLEKKRVECAIYMRACELVAK